MTRHIIIIEHLEGKLWKWCLIEYKHISEIVGRDNLWFTNIKRGSRKLENIGKVIKKSVKELNLKNACILDPAAEKTFSSKESEKFNFFIFGGILGDSPPRKRTEKELSSLVQDFEKRNIGKKQMPTDNAVYVVNEIIKGNANKLKFKDKAEIKLNKIESVILPYRYVLVNGKPLIRKEIVNYLKRKRGF